MRLWIARDKDGKASHIARIVLGTIAIKNFI